jgi:hypothetical protein
MTEDHTWENDKNAIIAIKAFREAVTNSQNQALPSINEE